MSQIQYPRANSPSSMPVKYDEIKVRMGFGQDVDPNEYRRRKYEFVFSPPSMPTKIRSRPIRNFIVNMLDKRFQF